ncbi:MAG: hypothetical protein JST47_06325 [Bacteroidetes bacterium]|nr:hypothetical protein [Bacteroidota bacterium]MBS1973853.1 hypothetical protein [Bacteroidota bacterium]
MKKFYLRNVVIRATLVAVLVIYIISCKKGYFDYFHHPAFNEIDTSGCIAPYNLNVVLREQITKNGFGQAIGFVKFRQNDTTHIINLYTWVFNLSPDHTYLLQRAVDPITDSSCSSTAWLTLGLGLTPQAIHTDRFGYAYEPLFRNVSSVPSGKQFRIRFQIVDSATMEPVLNSNCYSYTVR